MVRSGQTTNDLDPFLSCSSSSVDHSRQESADSGLGMGNNYSLPHTPEDFLSTNMDDNMDCTSGKYVNETRLGGPIVVVAAAPVSIIRVGTKGVSSFVESDNPGPSSMSVVDSQEMSSLDVTDDLVPSLQVIYTRPTATGAFRQTNVIVRLPFFSWGRNSAVTYWTKYNR